MLKDIRMTFVTEEISDDDALKYQLASVDEKFVMGGTRSRQWSIDRGRQIYLRMVTRGHEDTASRTKWTLFWKGEIVVVETDTIATTGTALGAQHAVKTLRTIDIPLAVRSEKDAILNDLLAALTAYGPAGVYSTTSSYSVQLIV